MCAEVGQNESRKPTCQASCEDFTSADAIWKFSAREIRPPTTVDTMFFLGTHLFLLRVPLLCFCHLLTYLTLNGCHARSLILSAGYTVALQSLTTAAHSTTWCPTASAISACADGSPERPPPRPVPPCPRQRPLTLDRLHSEGHREPHVTTRFHPWSGLTDTPTPESLVREKDNFLC